MLHVSLRTGDGNVSCEMYYERTQIYIITHIDGLAWVGPMTWNTSNFAKAQLEWMASPLGRQFDSAMGHPLDFKNIKICSKVSELDDMFAKGLPMTILASGSTLDSGPARDLIIKFADKAENTIILSSPQHCVHRNPIRSIGTPIGEIKTHLSAAAQLLEKWCVAKANGEEMDDSIEIDVLVPKREPLVGDELEKFIIEEEAALKHKLEKEEEEKLLREVELARGRLHLGEDGEPEPSLSSMNVDDSARVQSNVPLASNPPKKKSRFDSSLFLKFSKRKPMCFQIREEAVGISYPDEIGKGVFESSSSTANIIEDDYGIGINLDHFIDIVSGIDSSKTGGKLNDESLRRGFGFSIGGKQAQSNQRSNNIDISENTEEDLQMLEAADLAEGRGIIRGRNGNPPVKVFSVHETLEVLAEIRYIPLEGRVDARSARQSIRALQPRQVVVLGGGQPPPDFISNKDLIHQKDSLSEVSRLCDVVNEVFSSQQVHLNSDNIHVPKKAYYAPEDGETIEFEIGHAAYPARLIDTPYVVQKSEDSTVSLQKGMVFEELQELSLGDYTVSLVDLIATGQKVKDGGAYVLAPRQKSTEEKGTLSTSLRSASRSSMMISDGDVLLTDLRSEIIAQGMKAEYSTHDGFQQLVVSNRIILRRTLEGKINVEGPLCEDFYAVRKIVCSHYVTL